MAREVAAAKALIVQAFSHVEYPGDWCLVNGREGSEPELLEREFKGKDDWRALDSAFIDRAPQGYGSALSFFSDEAFHFYLPAYLLADLDEKLEQSDPMFALTHGLDRESRDRRINPRRYGERTWLDHARHKFAMFNAEEARAIVAYLECRLESAMPGELQKAMIREALATYWHARAARPDSRENGAHSSQRSER